MAVTMAVELRLGPPDESLKDLIQRRETFEWPTYHENYHSVVESVRTFVACYYISSW